MEGQRVLVQSYQKMSVDRPLRDRGVLVPGNAEDVNKQTARRDQLGVRSNRANIAESRARSQTACSKIVHKVNMGLSAYRPPCKK